MKILFDHGTPAPLRHQLTEHEISTAYEMGWAKLNNGDLLASAEKSFDAFITLIKTFIINKILLTGGWPFWFCPQQAGRKFKKYTNKVADAVNALQPGDFIELSF